MANAIRDNPSSCERITPSMAVTPPTETTVATHGSGNASAATRSDSCVAGVGEEQDGSSFHPAPPAGSRIAGPAVIVLLTDSGNNNNMTEPFSRRCLQDIAARQLAEVREIVMGVLAQASGSHGRQVRSKPTELSLPLHRLYANAFLIYASAPAAGSRIVEVGTPPRRHVRRTSH